MLEMRALELRDRPMVEEYLGRYPPEVADMLATNISEAKAQLS